MTFSNPVAIDFGYGSLDGISDALGDRTCIVVTTPGMESRGCFERLLAYCGERIVAIHSDVLPNPTLDSASNAAAELRHISADVIVVMGGGSAIDTAKAIAAQRHPELEASWLREYLDSDDGGGRDFAVNFTPPAIIGIPTTAGTGSEVTMWSTLWDPVLRHKHSLAHPALYPERAIIDPELTLTQPIALTVNSALDALSHALEAIWNHSANPVSDALAIRVLGTLPTALRECCVDPTIWARVGRCSMPMCSRGWRRVERAPRSPIRCPTR